MTTINVPTSLRADFKQACGAFSRLKIKQEGYGYAAGFMESMLVDMFTRLSKDAQKNYVHVMQMHVVEAMSEE